MTPEQAREKIIFALDVDKLSEIDRWAELLADKVGMFKVGKELFTSAGPAAVEGIPRNSGMELNSGDMIHNSRQFSLPPALRCLQ